MSDAEQTELSELQLWMARLLRTRRDLSRNESVAHQIPLHVTGNPRLSPAEQLEIYREQFWLRHTGSLVEDFPGLGGILGQQDWERVVEEYLESHPPTSYTLRNLGDQLPAFVERLSWLPHRELCTDMARLEWAYIELFDAADAQGLSPEKISALSPEAWETAVFELNPAFWLLRVRYPVADLRRALVANRDTVAIPDEGPENLVLYRHERVLKYKTVSHGAFALLEELHRGIPLGVALERAAERVPTEDFEESLGSWFEQWGRLGWVVDVKQSATVRQPD
jgi:hypothetical protein